MYNNYIPLFLCPESFLPRKFLAIQYIFSCHLRISRLSSLGKAVYSQSPSLCVGVYAISLKHMQGPCIQGLNSCSFTCTCIQYYSRAISIMFIFVLIHIIDLSVQLCFLISIVWGAMPSTCVGLHVG